MKNVKKYIKLYLEHSEESNKKHGYYYPPRSWEDFELWQNKTFQKYIIEDPKKDIVDQTQTYMHLIADDFADFGYFAVFKKEPLNFQDLNDVIYQISRCQYIDMWAPMVTGITFHHVLSAFASNDTQLADTFLPDDFTYSTNMLYTDMVINLFLIYYKKREDLKDSIIPIVKKYLAGKRSIFDRGVVEYFLALIDKNSKQASASLQEICVGYQKRGDINKLEKCFVAEVHGLYHMVRFIDEDFFVKLQQPNHPSFFVEFEEWQKANNYPKGKLFYTYPPKMDYMNKLLQANLPKLNKDEIYNTEVSKIFARKLAENVNSR